jgi:transketolase
MLSKNLYKQNIKIKASRDAVGDALLELGRKNKDVVVLSADLAESTRIDKFAKQFPKRFFELGVAEQNMAGVAAGLALSGKTAFAASFGVFSPGRNWDQIRVSICYSQANVKILSTHTGLSVGADGASHQALEDIAITRCLPNMTILVPGDYIESKKAILAAGKIKGPVYVRLSRQASPIFTTQSTSFKIGKANILTKGTDLTIVACGPSVYEALLAAKELQKKKIKVEVIDLHTIKPLDKTTILRSVKKTKHLITVEDHQVMGGMGSAVVEMLAENYPIPTQMVGVRDSFGESGKSTELWDKYKISFPHIIKAALNLTKK